MNLEMELILLEDKRKGQTMQLFDPNRILQFTKLNCNFLNLFYRKFSFAAGRLRRRVRALL